MIAKSVQSSERAADPSMTTMKIDVQITPTTRETMTPVVGLMCWTLSRAKKAVAPNPTAADRANRMPSTTLSVRADCPTALRVQTQ